MWVLVPTDRWIRKAVTESVASSSVYQNDDELFFSIGAGEEWSFGATVLATCAAAAPDIKIQWTFPAGALWVWSEVGGQRLSGMAAYTDGASSAIAPTSPGFDIGAGLTSAIIVQGAVTAAAATGGLVRMQWAQLTPGVSPTRVLLGSSLWARRVA